MPCHDTAQAFADLLGLLSHENADIAADVLELFKDLTEEDVVQDSVGFLQLCMPPDFGTLLLWCWLYLLKSTLSSPQLSGSILL
jgi:hypothetical protein